MAKPNSTATVRAQPYPIPRYIQSLHNIAAQAGLKTSWKMEKDDNGEFIQSVWRGTKGQFRNTHLLTPKYRFPLTMGRVLTTYRLRGDMAKVEDGYDLKTDFP